jgi:hypothetical protein
MTGLADRGHGQPGEPYGSPITARPWSADAKTKAQPAEAGMRPVRHIGLLNPAVAVSTAW